MDVSRLEIPDRHLTRRGEDEWEKELGDTGERTAAIGRTRFEFLEKADMPIPEFDESAGSLAQTLGQKSLQLVRSTDVALREEDAKARRAAESDSDGSDDDDGGDSDGGGSDDSSAASAEDDDDNAILDIDWDTSAWSVNEIESSCATLISDCQNTPSTKLKRRDLATKMLLRLMDRHSVATKYVESALETVVNRGLPTMNFGIDEVVFNISHLLAALAPHMADKLSRLNVVPRVVRLLLLEMDLAARVAQNRFRVMRKRRQMRGSDLPVDVRMRQKMMQNMKTDDLNAKWRALKRSDGVAGVPVDFEDLGVRNTRSALEAVDVLRQNLVEDSEGMEVAEKGVERCGACGCIVIAIVAFIAAHGEVFAHLPSFFRRSPCSAR